MSAHFGQRLKFLVNRPGLRFVVAFLPWIVFSIVRQSSLLGACVLAIFLMGLCNFRELKKGFVLPWGSALVFALLALNELFQFSPWMSDHIYVLINSALACIIWFSLLINKPFTLQYAREEVDRSRWNHPLFLKINWILTIVWAVLMTISALPGYFLTTDQIGASWFWGYGLSLLAMIIGFRCNKMIPSLLKKRERP